jgi:hypothetical protein
MMSEQSYDDARWHLDKKVPISIIVAMFVQFGGGIWFLSRLESRVVALETERLAQHNVDEAQDRFRSEALGTLRADMRDINTKLDRIIEYSYAKK